MGTVLTVLAMLGLIMVIIGGIIFLMKKPFGSTLMVIGALIWAIITVLLWFIGLF